MKLKYFINIQGVMFLGEILINNSMCVPAGTFRTECHERHFWLFVESSFIGSMVRFGFEDHHGFHFLSSHQTAVCGYTALYNHRGDLVFRASFLACHVDNQQDSEYSLRLWLVNTQVNGEVAVYPFWLRCSTLWPWGVREVVCEENYMGVSIQRPVLTVSSHGQEKVLPPHYGSGEKSGKVWNWTVMFHRAGAHPEETRPRSLVEASTLGYHLSESGSRIVLRCPYSSPLSYTLKDKGVDLDVVSATILYPLLGTVLVIDATVACAMNEPTVEGSHLLWSIPLFLSPLAPGGVSKDRGIRIGLETQALSQREIKDKGFEIGLRDGMVDIRIPFGTEGGHIESGVVDGQYSQSMSVNLFYAHQWEDKRWPLTHLRSLRILRTPYIPLPLTLINHTVVSQRVFSVSLGAFLPDVDLQSLTVGDTLVWTQCQSQDEVEVDLIPHPNGSHSYQLHVPFSYPHVLHKDVGDGYISYTLPLLFTLFISARAQVFHHADIIVSRVLEQPAPERLRLEGLCTERGLLVLLHQGARDLQWELFLGANRIDWKLIEMGGFTVETKKDLVSVEIPLFSPGMTYEELSLQGLVVKVEVSLIDVDSLKVKDSLVQRCAFPVRELLVCLPEGRMVAVVDTTHSIPPTPPNRTTLLDPSCVPEETDSARALFSFGLDSCGTTVTTEGDFLVYENQVRYAQQFIPTDDPLIHRDSPYRLTIQCRYPADDTVTGSVYHRGNSTSLLSHLLLSRARREDSVMGKRQVILDGLNWPGPDTSGLP
ncbi:uncharacterized protein LOC134009721 isoform X2 [Osmerus eperlanus]|uniref:uncharacterized protein LOC134009721 isoform X2 n=1 Tax=Osmerus eperlanus TaxID=29151 RepID=UPI002E0DE945